MVSVDAISLEVFRHLFRGVAEEMGVKLRSSAFSPNIKERRDYSCAIFDGEGRMIEQAAHIPVHLGSTPASVRAALDAVPDWSRGDAVLVNDPYAGGTHLPDVTLVSPGFGSPKSRRPDYFVVNRAHHADIGGAEAGSMAPAQEIFAEGLRIPPIRWIREGTPDPDITALVLHNVRTPEERRADLMAQWAANLLGVKRLGDLWNEYGRAQIRAHMQALLQHAEQAMRRLIATFPSGKFSFEDALDDDGLGNEPGPRLRVVIERRRGRLRVDFRGSDPQVAGALNANRAITLSAVLYALRLLAPVGTPTNHGCLEVVDVLTRPGSIVDARPPAAMAAGNVETSQRIVDVLLGALGKALPGRLPAASAGTMFNLTLGGTDPDGCPFTYYETTPGGAGAGPGGDGAACIQTHMTNTRNTPVEALEREFPLRVRRYSLRKGSGGRGAHRGGAGVVRRFEMLVPMRVALIAERFVTAPYGINGGEPGASGSAARITRQGRKRSLRGKVVLDLEPGEQIEVRSPGGGGWGAREESSK